MPDEFGSYYQEVAQYNLIMHRKSTRQVLMAANIDPSQIQAPLVINGEYYPVYAYILLPYYTNGNLRHLLWIAKSSNIPLTPGLENYLWLQCLLCVVDLLDLGGLSHRILKPEDFIFDNNWRLMLSGFD